MTRKPTHPGTVFLEDVMKPLHISCTLNADCDYFLTTDRKLLNHEVDGIRILDPVAFISEQEDETND